MKTSEVKIEKYKTENDEGHKFGVCPINLAEFIGLGIKYVTIKMAEGQIYLTMRLSVIPAGKDTNVL